MDKEDIIRMARKARMPYFYGTWEIANLDGLERFAALVAEEVRGRTIESEKAGWLHALDKVVKEEREACRLIVLDNSDAEGICCTDDVIEVFRQRGEK